MISLDASLRSRLQQKSQPRNARREIFAGACAGISRALRLCRKSGSHARQEQAQNRDKIGTIKRVKTTTLSINYTLAGAPATKFLKKPNCIQRVDPFAQWRYRQKYRHFSLVSFTGADGFVRCSFSRTIDNDLHCAVAKSYARLWRSTLRGLPICQVDQVSLDQ
jgi:hypothetical protein